MGHSEPAKIFNKRWTTPWKFALGGWLQNVHRSPNSEMFRAPAERWIFTCPTASKVSVEIEWPNIPQRNMFFYILPLTFVIALKVWQSIFIKRGVLSESQTKILSLTLQVVLLPGIPPIQVCIPHKVVSCQTLIYWQGFRLWWIFRVLTHGVFLHATCYTSILDDWKQSNNSTGKRGPTRCLQENKKNFLRSHMVQILQVVRVIVIRWAFFLSGCLTLF